MELLYLPLRASSVSSSDCTWKIATLCTERRSEFYAQVLPCLEQPRSSKRRVVRRRPWSALSDPAGRRTHRAAHSTTRRVSILPVPKRWSLFTTTTAAELTNVLGQRVHEIFVSQCSYKLVNSRKIRPIPLLNPSFSRVSHILCTPSVNIATF